MFSEPTRYVLYGGEVFAYNLFRLGGDLFALNLNDGSLAWKTKMGETTYDCRPTYTNGLVVCNNLFGGLRAYNAANGERVFQYKTGAGLQFAWPTVDGTTIYQPSMDGTLTAAFPPCAACKKLNAKSVPA